MGPERLDPRSDALHRDPVERALADIRHIARASALELALDVGEVVFHHIFRGDAAAVRKRGPKDASFRRLALHPELPLSAANLWRAVAIYELSLRIPGVTRSKHLGISHVRTLLGLPEDVQHRLVTQAEAETWSVARLEKEAAARRSGRGGRHRKSELERTLDTLRKLASIPTPRLASPSAVSALGSEDLEVALETLREIRARAVELERLLRRSRARR